MLFYLQCLFAQTEESKGPMINIMSKFIFIVGPALRFYYEREVSVTLSLYLIAI